MTQRTIIIGAIALLAIIILGLGFFFFTGGEDNPAEAQAPAEFTPPPLSDNPPMSGSDIDNIHNAIRNRNNPQPEQNK